MRAEALVFLHVLAAATLVGALLAVAILSAHRAARHASVVAVASALVTVALAEAARERGDAAGTWVDVGSLLGYAGLLLPAAGLAVLSRRAERSERLRPWPARTASAMTLVALAAAFLMAAKP